MKNQHKIQVLAISKYDPSIKYKFNTAPVSYIHTYLNIKNQVKTNLSDLVLTMTNIFYKEVDRIKTLTESKSSLIDFVSISNEIDNNAKYILTNGILFSKSHLDVIELKENLKEGNLLIIVSNINKIQYLKWNSRDEWWVNISNEEILTNNDFSPINF